MAFESKKTPGKRFGSIFAQKHYDENHSEDGMHAEGTEGKESEHEEKPAVGEEREELNEGENEKEAEEKTGEEEHEEHPVVTEHGAAHKVVIHHDHEAGRHTVTSHHKDGHTHTAVHEVPEKAHHEGSRLAGIAADGQEKDHQSPYDQKGKAQQGASSEEDGFAMPDLS